MSSFQRIQIRGALNWRPEFERRLREADLRRGGWTRRCWMCGSRADCLHREPELREEWRKR